MGSPSFFFPSLFLEPLPFHNIGIWSDELLRCAFRLCLQAGSKTYFTRFLLGRERRFFSKQKQKSFLRRNPQPRLLHPYFYLGGFPPHLSAQAKASALMDRRFTCQRHKSWV